MTTSAKPLLGDMELLLTQEIKTTEKQDLTMYEVPMLSGNAIQNLNRRSTSITLYGIFNGENAKGCLEILRQMFHTGKPLPFTADITTSSDIQNVIITDLQVNELASKANFYSYKLSLVEYIEPEEPVVTQDMNDEIAQEAEDTNESAENQIEDGMGILEVVVDPEEQDEDLSPIKILVQGRTANGEDYEEVLEEQVNGVFRKNNMPEGQYTITLLLAD